MVDPKNLFSKEVVTVDKGVFIFNQMQENDDYWNNEKKHLLTDNSILKHVPEKKFLLGLEVGAGNGRVTEPLSTICDQLIALESSEKGIKALRKRKLRNVTPVLSFDVELPFKNDVFDFVASVTVIEHIPKEKCFDFLREHYRVLKPGGAFFIRNDAWMYGVLEKLGYFDKEQPDPTHVNMITPRKLQRILKKVGFTIEEANYLPFSRFVNLNLPLMDIFSTKGNFYCRKRV